MKQQWEPEKLIEQFILTLAELAILPASPRQRSTSLCLAVLGVAGVEALQFPSSSVLLS